MADDRDPIDEEWDDDDLYDDVDGTDDSTLDMVECPHCGQEIYEEALQCPHCGEWVSPSTSAWQGRSWWWILLGLLGSAAVIFTMLL